MRYNVNSQISIINSDINNMLLYCKINIGEWLIMAYGTFNIISEV